MTSRTTTNAWAAAIAGMCIYGCQSSAEMGTEEMLPPDEATTGNDFR